MPPTFLSAATTGRNTVTQNNHMNPIATCINASFRDIDQYDQTERTIGYETALRHIGLESMREFTQSLGYDRNLHIKNDYHVSYGKGVFRGKPAICIHWSSIHHFFS